MYTRRVLIPGLVLLAVAMFLGGAFRNHPGGVATAAVSSQHERITVQFFRDPHPVPELTMTTIDGRSVSLADLRGKVTIVNFWATWCPPCRAEIPDLIALQTTLPGHVQILGISEDQGSVDTVRTFVEEYGINYPIIMATPELKAAFPGVAALPTSYVLDREARIVQRHVGILSRTVTEHEVRVLAGLPNRADVVYVDSAQPTGLVNAAQATDIPGIDLDGLSAERRVETLLRLNEEACTCGCELTVAKCRTDDPACGVSLPIARRIAAEIAGRP
ncbi:MAG: TlpA disulfide reductase family protein [Vicinamibacterales bacterium]